MALEAGDAFGGALRNTSMETHIGTGRNQRANNGEMAAPGGNCKRGIESVNLNGETVESP